MAICTNTVDANLCIRAACRAAKSCAALRNPSAQLWRPLSSIYPHCSPVCATCAAHVLQMCYKCPLSSIYPHCSPTCATCAAHAIIYVLQMCYRLFINIRRLALYVEFKNLLFGYLCVFPFYILCVSIFFSLSYNIMYKSKVAYVCLSSCVCVFYSVQCVLCLWFL